MAGFPKGFSFQVNGGSYGGFRVHISSLSARVCLGWIAFTIFFFDVEPVFMAALKAYNAKQQEVERG